MRYLILCAALLPAIAAAQPATKSTKPPKAKCEAPGVRQVDGVQRPGLHKLGDLPPAKPIYTVLREIDGCPKPVSVPVR